MSQSPKVSVITITYNAEDFLERTIKSVIEQDYDNIEYVIIDGKSKDGTAQIIEKYRSNINVLVCEPDKGLYDAMNKALDNATGDYIVYMNAGDVMRDSHSLSDVMKGSNNADIVYGIAVKVDEAGNQRPWHKKTPSASQLSAKSFINGMIICHQCMIVKRSSAVKYNLSIKIAADIDWSIRTMKNVKTKHFNNDVFCLFLEGGVSDERRVQAIKERFMIGVKHFGWLTTLSMQFGILFGALKRGRMD
jgi:glycosyltransferase involved in cell wall biosynthesis